MVKGKQRIIKRKEDRFRSINSLMSKTKLVSVTNLVINQDDEDFQQVELLQILLRNILKKKNKKKHQSSSPITQSFLAQKLESRQPENNNSFAKKLGYSETKKQNACCSPNSWVFDSDSSIFGKDNHVSFLSSESDWLSMDPFDPIKFVPDYYRGEGWLMEEGDHPPLHLTDPIVREHIKCSYDMLKLSSKEAIIF